MDVDLSVQFETFPGNLVCERKMVVVPRVDEHVMLIDQDAGERIYKILSVLYVVEQYRFYVNQVTCSVELVSSTLRCGYLARLCRRWHHRLDDRGWHRLADLCRRVGWDE